MILKILIFILKSLDNSFIKTYLIPVKLIEGKGAFMQLMFKLSLTCLCGFCLALFFVYNIVLCLIGGKYGRIDESRC